MAYHYAHKYGVHVPSDTEEEDHGHGYGYGHVDCGDRSCNTDDYTYADLTGDDTYTRYLFTSKDSNGVDTCDKSDYDCPKSHTDPDSVSYFSSETTEEEERGPSTGTSMSSNSTGQHHSESDSVLDSSSDESTDTEADGSALSEDLCAHVILQPASGSDTWGWVEFYAPALGHFNGSTRVEGYFEGLNDNREDPDGNGIHLFHVHEFGDMRNNCAYVGPIYDEPDALNETVRASSRGLGNFYDWKDTVALDGAKSILGRSVVIHNDDAAKTKIACGIIQPGCSPCRDGSCFPKEEEQHGYAHYQPYHPFGYHHL